MKQQFCGQNAISKESFTCFNTDSYLWNTKFYAHGQERKGVKILFIIYFYLLTCFDSGYRKYCFLYASLFSLLFFVFVFRKKTQFRDLNSFLESWTANLQGHLYHLQLSGENKNLHNLQTSGFSFHIVDFHSPFSAKLLFMCQVPFGWLNGISCQF